MIKTSMAMVAATLVACSSPQDVVDAVGVAAPQGGSSKAEIADARAVSVENDQMTFHFSWPAEAAAIPALNAVFETRAKTKQDDFAATTAEAQADAAKYGYPYRAYDFSRTWEVASDTPRFISFAGSTYAYTGGAHGNSWFDSTLWDREVGAEMAQTDLFTSPGALESAVRTTYCDTLLLEKATRLGPEYVKNVDPLENCPKLDELVIVAGSSNGETFDQIALLAAPYVAGSYAEGPYEVSVRVTPAVIDAVKPEYRTAFSLGS